MADPLQQLRETPVEELRERLRVGIQSKQIRQVLREFIPRYLTHKASLREIWAFADADMWRPENPEEAMEWGSKPAELDQFSFHLRKLPSSVIHSYVRWAEERDNPDLAAAFRQVLDTQETDDEENDDAVGGKRRPHLTPRRKRTLKKTTRKTRKQKRRN